MSIHRYAQGSIIDEIIFKRADNGSVRAYLHASATTDNDKLPEIKEKLSAHGWQCIPSTQSGKAVLEIRNFGHELQLKKVLSQNSWVNGSACIEQSTEDKISFKDQLKARSLQASGLFYLLGDAAYMTYGYKKGHFEDVLAGLMYLGGSATLVGYGSHNNASIEIHDIAKKMQEEVKKQADILPDNCSLSAITKDYDRGIIKKADDFLTRYPSEVMNSFFGLAGASILASTIKHSFLTKQNGMLSIGDAKIRKNAALLDAGVGLMTMGAGALSALLEEKKHDPDAPSKQGLELVWEKIQQNPLSIAGIGYIISTFFHAASSYKEYGVAKANNDQIMLKSVPFRAAFVGCSLIAELLMAASSKGHGSGVISDSSVRESLISLAADLIVKQPENEREHLIDYLSTFLGSKDVLAMKDQDVKNALQKQVELLKNNPWAECVTTVESTEKSKENHAENHAQMPHAKSPINFTKSANEPTTLRI